MIAAMIARLKSEIPDLGNRVQGAADLAALMQRGAVPTVTPTAFVLPAGIGAGKVDAMTGAYRQNIVRRYSVALCLTSRDRTGERALDEAESLIEAIVAALVGWDGDSEAVGVLTLVRVSLIRFAEGVATYEIQFSIEDQLRGSA